MFFSRRWMLCCRQPNCRNSLSELLPGSRIRRKHHLHQKTPSPPSELKNAHAFLISQSDRQCFSHEDGCFAAGSRIKRAVRLNCDLTPESGAKSDFNCQLIIHLKNAIVKNTCVRLEHLILRYLDEPHTRFERRSYVRTFKICKY